MKPVVIVGNALREKWPYGHTDAEYWSFNSGARSKQRLDVAFQMHDEPRYVCNGEAYMAWLRTCPVPVYMREHHPEFPTSIAYPLEEVFAMVGSVKQGYHKLEDLRFLTSTAAYAIALAILQGRPRIDVYGVELWWGSEYRNQREGFAFWSGFAGGRGISMNINCADDIFKRPLYGLGLEKAKKDGSDSEQKEG